MSDGDPKVQAEPLERLEFDAATLMGDHSPIWRDANKRVVFDIACHPDDAPVGRLTYTRWAAASLPEHIDVASAAGLAVGRDGYFDYAPTLDAIDGVEWHVNFADPHLFFAYGSSLFAQDEMQVAEHPALGSLREALEAAGHRAVTVDRGVPSPVLVTGVERRVRIATDPDAKQGRPNGLYGNAFARASADAVARATMRIEPPTITNLIAMAAPTGGRGRYRVEEIQSVLVTALTGFRAAVLESERLRGAAGPVAVHTGYWGCGAFGGNRVLMAMLQVIAAQMAGLDRLAFHVGHPGGMAPLDEALRIVRDDFGSAGRLATADLIDRIAATGFEWGVGDGN